MPSIGKDLVKVRKHLGLTLQDIQFATKLPQHTLEKIEDDTIFVDAEEGPIYTRNFVRSYGRVLKIDDDLLIEALNLREQGKYNHQLLRDYPELSDAVPVKPKKATEKDAAEPSPSAPGKNQAETQSQSEKSEEDQSRKTDEQQPEVPDKQEGKSKPETDAKSPLNDTTPSKSGTKDEQKAVSKETDSTTEASAAKDSKPPKSTPKKESTEQRTTDVDWANVGQKINREEKQLPAWVVGVIILVIILGAAGYFVYQSGILNSEDSPQEEITTPANQTTGSSLSIELDEPEPESMEEAEVVPEPVATMSDTLEIVVHAAFGNIDPIRVWSDTKPRFDPYWIEEGNAMIFDFENTVQVRGPYDNMLIFMNGHLIENVVQNFYNTEEDYVELNRSDFTSDTKWSETVDLQIPDGVEPPQDIRTRPTFQ
jgi:hypothetical protein